MSDPEPRRDVPSGDPLLLTPEEAATVLRIGRTTMYALIKAGDLRPVHIGRSCRISRAELERYVHRLQAPEQTAPRSPAGADQTRMGVALPCGNCRPSARGLR